MPGVRGVSSFGISGTNAHVILEEAPATESATASRAATVRLLPALPALISAKTDAALRRKRSGCANTCMLIPSYSSSMWRYSLATTRSHFDHRAVLVAKTARLCSALSKRSLRTDPMRKRCPWPQRLGRQTRVCLSGPGLPMGSDGAARCSKPRRCFRAQLIACAARACSPRRLVAPRPCCAVRTGRPSFERVDVVQPVLFAVMVRLAALWRSWASNPTPSSATARARLPQPASRAHCRSKTRPRSLRCAAVPSSDCRDGVPWPPSSSAASELGPHLEAFGQRLSIAAVNSPRSSVVSGDAEAIDALLDELASLRSSPARCGSTTPRIARKSRALPKSYRIALQPSNHAAPTSRSTRR